MSGWFGGKQSNSASPVTSLRLQTSTRGRPIPIAYGKTRIQGNLIWYGDFVATPHEQSAGGKGGGGSTTSYTYSTAFLMGICEGAINGVSKLWRQKDVFAGGNITQDVWKLYEYKTVPTSSPYQVTVDNASTFKADGFVVWMSSDYGETYLAAGTDYTVANGVYTFIAQYAGASIKIRYQYTSVGAYQDACTQAGLTFMSGTYTQSPLGWMTTKHAGEDLSYRGLVYVGASAYDMGNSPDLKNHSFEVDTQTGYSSSIRDANPKDIVTDLLTNTHYGAMFPSSRIGDMKLFNDYCVANNIFLSPAYTEQEAAKDILARLFAITNSGAFYSGGQLKFVPYGDISATANGVTYSPNVTPIYDLTDDDFLGDNTDDPVKVTRKPQSDSYNCIRVKFYNRANDYNEEIAEAKDQSSIELYGLRAMDTLEFKEICDLTTARNVAQIVLQRSLYIRNTFTFRLSWAKCLLEPTDLITITESGLGMNKVAARITAVEEDEYGELSIEAEEFPLSVCNAALYNTQPALGYNVNFNAAPGNALTPVMFEAPIELALSADYVDLWIATGSTNADYGGCEVWLSLDNSTYKKVGSMDGSSRYGSSTAALAAASGIGVASQTLSVHLNTGGQLLSGTDADVQVLNTLCYLGGEFLAYKTATLTATASYDLATLNRGAYSSGYGSHASGQDFVRIDDALVKVPLTKDYIGKQLYVKLLAFNKYGGGKQSLQDVSAYTFNVIGRFATLPPPDVLSFNLTVKADGTRLFDWDASSAPKDVVNGGGYKIKYRTSGSGTAWANMTKLADGLITNTKYQSNLPAAGTYDFAIVAVDRLGNESQNPQYITNAAISTEPVSYSAAVNLLANSDFQIYTGTNNGPTSLYKWGTYTNNGSSFGRNNFPWNNGRGGAWWTDSTNVGNNNYYADIYQEVPVTVGKQYEFSFFAGPHRCSVWGYIAWIDSNGNWVGNIAGTNTIASNPQNQTPISSWPFAWATGTAPTGAVKARCYIRKWSTDSGFTDSWAFVQRVMFCAARSNVSMLTATPWIESGVDALHGAAIEAATVNTQQLTDKAASDMLTLQDGAVSSYTIRALRQPIPLGDPGYDSSTFLTLQVPTHENSPGSGVGFPIALDACCGMNVSYDSTYGAYVSISVSRYVATDNGGGSTSYSSTGLSGGTLSFATNASGSQLSIPTNPFSAPTTLSLVDPNPPAGSNIIYVKYIYSVSYSSRSFSGGSGTLSITNKIFKAREIKK